MEYYQSPGDFWISYGVSYQMLDEKTQKLRNILNARDTDETLLTTEEGDYVVNWFNDYMVEKSKTFIQEGAESHLDELFPQEAEIIEMLEIRGLHFLYIYIYNFSMCFLNILRRRRGEALQRPPQ